MKTPEPILFYGRNSSHPQLSNFFYAPFELEGRVWPTVEHYYVAMKNSDPEWQERVRKTESPGRVKRMGRQVQLRDNWDTIKIIFMEKAVRAKFSQNHALRHLLIDTGNRPLHENCEDPWWGGGPNFPKGRDLLGKILGRVRIELQKEVAE